MRGLGLGLGAALALVAGLSLPSRADPGALAAATADFYYAYQSLPRGGIPSADRLPRLKPHVTPALYALLAEALAAETRHTEATKGTEPPLVEGDPFTSLFEGASAFEVGGCTEEGAAGRCAVDLTYKDGSGKTAWQDTALLAKTAEGWRIDNIAYGGTWDFGNKGRLTDLLRSVAAETPQP